MAPPVNVLSIATAVPPHQLDQCAVADAARKRKLSDDQCFRLFGRLLHNRFHSVGS